MNNQTKTEWAVSYFDVESEETMYEIYEDYEDAHKEYEWAYQYVNADLFTNLEMTKITTEIVTK
jgi:hypothetical protein